MRKKAACLILAVLSAAALVRTAAADQGIRGRASLAGTVDAGVKVRAYRYTSGSFGPATAAPVLADTATATDGTYRLPLPPGQYVVEALKKADGNTQDGPETGDLHCLYSGSPVTVAADRWTAVGFNLAPVPPERRRTADRSQLEGRITFKGTLQEKVYLYLYKDAASVFRGPAALVQPVATGSFRVRVPPGTYYLVARKRARGGTYGPIEVGDLFNFYARNPVVLAEGETIELEIPLIERLSLLEDDPDAYRGLSVRVLGAEGQPLPGHYVLAYDVPARSGPPLATSGATDAEGRANLHVPAGRPLYLRARASLGGPLAEGAAYADADLDDAGRRDLGELTFRVGP